MDLANQPLESSKSSSSSILKIFNPKKNPKLEIEIRPITEENMEEIGLNIGDIFAKYEPLTCKAGITGQYYYDNYISHLGKSCVRDNLGIAAYNHSTGEWIGAIMNEDVLTGDANYHVQDPENRFTSMMKLLHIIDKYEEDIVEKPTKRYEIIRLVFMAINPEYGSMGITQELIKFFMYEHSLVKDSKLLVCECTNIRSSKTLESIGWQNSWEMGYSELAKMDKDLESYADLRDFMNERGGKDIAEKCYLMTYRRS